MPQLQVDAPIIRIHNELKRNNQPQDWPVQRDIPLEFVVSIAVCIILIYCPVAPKSPSVIFFTEQAETIADPTKRLPGEV